MATWLREKTRSQLREKAAEAVEGAAAHGVGEQRVRGVTVQREVEQAAGCAWCGGAGHGTHCD